MALVYQWPARRSQVSQSQGWLSVCAPQYPVPLCSMQSGSGHYRVVVSHSLSQPLHGPFVPPKTVLDDECGLGWGGSKETENHTQEMLAQKYSSCPAAHGKVQGVPCQGFAWGKLGA